MVEKRSEMNNKPDNGKKYHQSSLSYGSVPDEVCPDEGEGVLQVR